MTDSTKPRKYVLFGAGSMGRAIAYDLLRSDADCHILMVDRDADNLASAAAPLDAARVRTLKVDAQESSLEYLVQVCKDASVVISASRYDLNVSLTMAAIRAGAHCIDLGGNTATVEAQFALHDDAVAAGVSVLPDCGIAPGAVSVLARHCIDRVPDATHVQIRVGGLPQEPKPPLEYALAFSAHGLVANYGEPCEILRDGKLEIVPPLGGTERCHFPQLKGCNPLEAVHTSDGLATLAKTYKGRIQHLDYKTLRYRGHWERIKVLHELGLFDPTAVYRVNGQAFSARDFMADFLNRTLDHGVPDLLVLRVCALRRVPKGDRTGVVLDLIDKKDPVTGHSAMQRTTGYSASICAQMLASGEISARGVLKHEEVVPPLRFIEEWRQRGIVLTEYDQVP